MLVRHGQNQSNDTKNAEFPLVEGLAETDEGAHIMMLRVVLKYTFLEF